MFKERGGRQISTALPSGISPIAEVDGAADAERALAAKERCAKVLSAARETFEGSATVPGAHRRVAKVIANVSQQNKCKSAEGWDMLANHTEAFVREATDCLEGLDGDGLTRAITAYRSTANVAAGVTPAPPPLMPTIGGETFRQFGWDVEEQEALRTVLLFPMTGIGVKRGDRVVEIDEEGVKLSSGLRLTRGAIVAACVPANQVNR